MGLPALGAGGGAIKRATDDPAIAPRRIKIAGVIRRRTSDRRLGGGGGGGGGGVVVLLLEAVGSDTGGGDCGSALKDLDVEIRRRGICATRRSP
jgi:hypothetical protein